MELGLTVVLGTIAAIIAAFLYRGRRRDLPPGPFALPLLGSVGFLWRSSRIGLPPHKLLEQTGSAYGPVMSIWVGPKLMVVLNGYEIIRKAFVEQATDFSDRPNWISQIRNATKIGKGISWSNGEEWKKIRKFTIKHLRDFGFGTNAMEDLILLEMDKVTEVLMSTRGKPTDISNTLKFAVTNVICDILYGQTFDYGDPFFITLIRYFDMLVKGKGFTSVTNFIPECLYPLFPKENELHQERKRNTTKMREHFEKLIETHEESFHENETRDFLDYYIKVKRGIVDEDLELVKEPYFNNNNIYRVINDLFMSGCQTTSTTMQWIILYLIEYPTVQDRCRDHIRDLVGEKRVRSADRPKLPYIEAVIQEVLRLSNIVPLGVPRTNAERDIFINGYRIPKKTIIIANIYSAHVDANIWNNPQDFNPERFLGSDGELRKVNAFMPLSVGPRICPAESLVKLNLFLMTATLLQRFKLERDENEPRHTFSTKPDQFITLAPSAYKVKIKSLS